jgi:polyphosphate kinase
MDSIRDSLRERAWGAVVRVEIDPAMPADLRGRLLQELDAESAIADIRPVPLGRSSLMELAGVDRPDLKHLPFTPRVPAVLAPNENVFDAIKARDILLHHPYDAFGPVVQLIEAAADDPDVLAIKQTLYRVGRRSPIIAALVRARRNGKQVAVLVELKARGDEENNIEWAETLEREGIHVAHGIVGLKTHCKALLIVRRESDGIRRYVHLATGNYNAGTARLYTDYGYLTARPDFGEDMTNLFNSLTGYSRQTRYNRILVSPGGWRRRLVELIDREMSNQARGEPGLIRIKVNGLTDTRLTDLLYRASVAGVRIELMVRGMCCLRPGVPGMSENIRVVSLVGRFLEHSRVFHFRNGGEDEVYLGSADVMPRNLDRRIEAVFPVPDDAWRQDVLDVLDLGFRDTARLRVLGPDGTYQRAREASSAVPVVEAQEVLLAKARAGG